MLLWVKTAKFIQQKNAESMQNNRAFANWIARIEELEKYIDEQRERIIELEDTAKKQKKCSEVLLLYDLFRQCRHDAPVSRSA